MKLVCPAKNLKTATLALSVLILVFAAFAGVGMKHPSKDTAEKVYSQVFLQFPDADPVKVKVKEKFFARQFVDIEVCVKNDGVLTCTTFNEYDVNEFGYLDNADVQSIRTGVESSRMKFGVSASHRYLLQEL